jgi:hypothetical protein
MYECEVGTLRQSLTAAMARAEMLSPTTSVGNVETPAAAIPGAAVVGAIALCGWQSRTHR